mgnify:FL=1
MTLLSPIAGLIGALIGAPLLVAYYLLKLKRRPVRVSSTMYWEQAVHDLQVNVPFRWVRPTLLFLLHLLTLLTLLLALSRPAIETDRPRADRVFLLIDRSASMRAADVRTGDGETLPRFEAARRAAIERIDELTAGGSRVTLIAFAADAEVIGVPSSSAGPLRAALASLTPTDQPGDPRAALELVSSLAVGELAREDQPAEGGGPSQQTAPALALVVTDGGDLPRAGEPPLAAPGLTIAIEPVGPPPGTQLERDEAQAASPRNVGIAAYSAVRDAEDPARVRVFARLVNAAPDPASATVTLAFQGERAREIAATIPGASAPAAASPEPGQRIVTFDLDQPEPGLVTVAAVAPGDTLEADDTASSVLGPGRDPAILLVAPAGPGDRPAPDPVLEETLRAMDTRLVRTVTARRAARAQPAELAAFDLAIYDRVRADPPPPLPSLHFGRGFGSRTFPTLDDTPSTLVLSWDRTHPLMRDVALDTVRVGRRRALPGDDPSASVLARGETGPLLVAFDDGPHTRVVVGFELAQTNWPLQIGFPIFMVNAADELSRTGPGPGVSFTTTEPVLIESPPSDGPVRVEGPRSFIVDAEPAQDGRLPLGVLDRAGVYRAGDRIIAVNLLDAGESALRGPPEAGATGPDPARRPSGRGLERQVREFWPELLAAAVALLTLEWLLYALRMRG